MRRCNVARSGAQETMNTESNQSSKMAVPLPWKYCPCCAEPLNLEDFEIGTCPGCEIDFASKQHLMNMVCTMAASIWASITTSPELWPVWNVYIKGGEKRQATILSYILGEVEATLQELAEDIGSDQNPNQEDKGPK